LFKTHFEAFESGFNLGTKTQEHLRPNFIGFSDCFVTSVPLRSDAGELVRLVTVFSALSAAAIVMLTSLANKHPLRGGIDVGLATEIGPGEIYGTALERAYFLECKVAQYPRILVGDELWKYSNSVLAKFGKDQTLAGKTITAITHKIIELIANDLDGKRILDYLGAAALKNSAPGQKEMMIQPAYGFVLAEQSRVIAGGNSELIARYALFRGYFESRLPLWGIPVK
jgi:hypothetical protein